MFFFISLFYLYVSFFQFQWWLKNQTKQAYIYNTSIIIIIINQYNDTSYKDPTESPSYIHFSRL